MTECSMPTGRHFATSFWGPQSWRFIHIGSLNYRATPANKAAWRSFILHFLPATLPCATCRAHYMRRLPRFDLKKILESRRNLVVFWWNLHNDINGDVARKLGRPFRPLPFKAFCQMYKKGLKKN